VVKQGPARVMHCARPDDITRVWGLGIDGPPETDLLDDAIDEARRRDDRKVTFEWNPYAHPNLFRVMEERGFQIQEFTNCYVRDPAHQPDPPARPLGATLRIERIDLADIERIEASAQAWGHAILGAPAPDWLVQVARQAIAQACRTSFAALEGERVVGVGTVAQLDGVAFYGIASTIPSHRGQGIQSHLLHARTRHVRETGADIETIGSDPGTVSQRNIERVGFRCIYTKQIVKKVLRPKRPE
jgi:GNAT superfamily N-acetyltransferase